MLWDWMLPGVGVVGLASCWLSAQLEAQSNKFRSTHQGADHAPSGPSVSYVAAPQPWREAPQKMPSSLDELPNLPPRCDGKIQKLL